MKFVAINNDIYDELAKFKLKRSYKRLDEGIRFLLTEYNNNKNNGKVIK